jgi:hypothetical protein
MAKKVKTLETKLRSAIRLIWSRSAERRAVLKAATIDDPENGKGFNCPDCGRDWPIQMAEVDHIEPIGSLESWRDIESFIDRMFYGPQRAICKLCHKTKTKEDMRKIRAKHKIS